MAQQSSLWTTLHASLLQLRSVYQTTRYIYLLVSARFTVVVSNTPRTGLHRMLRYASTGVLERVHERGVHAVSLYFSGEAHT